MDVLVQRSSPLLSHPRFPVTAMLNVTPHCFFIDSCEIPDPYTCSITLLFVVALLSQTRNLITQINRVCHEICDIGYIITKKIHHPLSNCHRSKEHHPDTCEKDGRGCTRSVGNKKHAHCEDLQNSPNIQTHHERSSPPEPPLPEPPLLMSSHASSESCAVEASASSDAPPCGLMGDIAGSTMVFSSSQKETKEFLDK